MFYVFLKNGTVVDVLSEGDSNVGSLASWLADGRADEVRSVASFDEVRALIVDPQPSDPEQAYDQLEGHVRDLASKIETQVNGWLDRLESLSPVATDLTTLKKNAIEAGGKLLAKLRETRDGFKTKYKDLADLEKSLKEKPED